MLILLQYGCSPCNTLLCLWETATAVQNSWTRLDHDSLSTNTAYFPLHSTYICHKEVKLTYFWCNGCFWGLPVFKSTVTFLHFLTSLKPNFTVRAVCSSNLILPLLYYLYINIYIYNTRII